jgi:hypothetical protein
MARDLNNSYETFIGYADSCLTNQVDADNAFGGRRLRADSAPHWARVLGDLGHRVELLPARQVRAFVRSNKDDAADARAIWLAAQQSDIRRAPIKTIEQQAVMSLHRTRSHWVAVRTATINMVRVRCSLRGARTNSITPNWSSRSRMVRDSGVWSMCTRSAARRKLSSSATAMK